MLVLSPPRIIVRKRDRDPVPFVVRLSRSTKHGHAAHMTIHRFVELAIVAAKELPVATTGQLETQN
jgi:hypothetical protein